MSRKSQNSGRLIVGGPAQANLLPPEVGFAARGRVVRRAAIALVVLSVLLVVVASVGVSVLAAVEQGRLAEANARTDQLVQQQAKFSEVQRVKSLLATAEAAEQVGTSTEIDWKAYLVDIQNSLPSGTLVTNVSAETATPIADFVQPSVPLQGDRIGELRFTATSTSLPNVEAWLNSLAKLTGYVDAAPGSVGLNTRTELYEVTITMHINREALLLRFDEEARIARDNAAADANTSGDE
jgi:Tfp pilus assembly protein PilN